MRKLTDLEYLKLSKFRAFWYNFAMFFCAIPGWFVGLFRSIGKTVVNAFRQIGKELSDIAVTFRAGNWAVKLSFLIFGFGNLFYGQYMRGLLFLAFEIIFIAYMAMPSGGLYWLGKLNLFQRGATVGTDQGYIGYDELFDSTTWIDGDDSVRVLLYGLLTIIFIVAFIATWKMQINQCQICMEITATCKKIKSGKDDLRSLVDDQFHKTLLALPLTGILIFTVLPIIFMVLVAFTNYDNIFDGRAKLFQWVGFQYFGELFNFEKGGLGLAVRELLLWTLVWAVFATFSNYFLGMGVAMMINKRGIKIKKFWRTVLVMTIAVPQFVSLLYISKLFNSSGIIGEALGNIPFIAKFLSDNHYVNLWDSPTVAKVLLILINVWIGIPHIMLMATGILMNIPQDLYESSRIDGATGFQQYMKITLPYMLFVTGPYLLTSFVGNLNNFNVIYLLTGGAPTNLDVGSINGVSVGSTDLLITWMYKLTLGAADTKYYLASIMGILVFFVVAGLSLIVYNVIPSTKNEEDFK